MAVAPPAEVGRTHAVYNPAAGQQSGSVDLAGPD
jgi:hypothetical protein